MVYCFNIRSTSCVCLVLRWKRGRELVHCLYKKLQTCLPTSRRPAKPYVTNTTWENLQIANHKSIQYAEWMTLPCALRFSDFLRFCLSPQTTPSTISFLFPIVFGNNWITIKRSSNCQGLQNFAFPEVQRWEISNYVSNVPHLRPSNVWVEQASNVNWRQLNANWKLIQIRFESGFKIYTWFTLCLLA